MIANFSLRNIQQMLALPPISMVQLRNSGKIKYMMMTLRSKVFCNIGNSRG